MMVNVKKRSSYRLFFYIILSVITVTAVVIYFQELNKKIPKHIYINENQQIVVCMGIPASGEIIASSDSISVEAVNSITDLSKPVTFVAGTAGHYTMKVNLFGFITYRKIDVDVVDEKYVYPGGFQIGMYLHTDGVLVANAEQVHSDANKDICPWEGKVMKGDYIVAINDHIISEKEELAEEVNESQGEVVHMKIRRNNQIYEEEVLPVQCEDGVYRIGLWVKDDAQGIGTVTYIDENNHFAALGHGISDDNTGNVMMISEGRVYRTHVMSIIKGKNGTPGELLGGINYKQYNQIGTIKKNGANGIHGDLSEEIRSEYALDSMKIGYSYEVQDGKAQVRFYHDGSFRDYDINIEKLVNGAEKNITFQVVSPELLELTNGIVQGMSGCPIIQNGKIIGAVTHVFIDDSTKGYGIFIETMME
ncbi:MAG: SpoIVB peptidase [Lachnospira sp.]|nr:SpoIVB peptidase [Lachnospira sp.]